jgi:hypothetical protein
MRRSLKGATVRRVQPSGQQAATAGDDQGPAGKCRWQRHYKAVLLHRDAIGERFLVVGLHVLRQDESEAAALWPLVDMFVETTGGRRQTGRDFLLSCPSYSCKNLRASGGYSERGGRAGNDVRIARIRLAASSSQGTSFRSLVVQLAARRPPAHNKFYCSTRVMRLASGACLTTYRYNDLMGDYKSWPQRRSSDRLPPAKNGSC